MDINSKEKKRRDLAEIFCLGGIVIILFGVLMYLVLDLKYMEDNNLNPSPDSVDEDDYTPITSEPILPPVDNNNDKNTEEDLKKEILTGDPYIDNEVIDSNIKTKEYSVVKYFTDLNREVESNKDNNIEFIDRAKSLFNTTVDFLFYNSEIHGYTFSQLSTSAKIKVIKVALSIDRKIDSYFPEYKTKIKEKCSDLKEKAALLYLETTSNFCDSMGEDVCNEARKDFNNMKNSFGYTWDLLKEASTYSFTKLKAILSEWNIITK